MAIQVSRSARWLGSFVALCVLAGRAHAQQPAVEGRVMRAAENTPVAGALVRVPGTGAQAVSGSDGRFTVQVPDLNATLVVSALGFAADTVALGGRRSVVVLLSGEALQLSELVVVGYGTQKRSDVTGAVASIDTRQLQDQASASVAQSLQGVVPGVAVTSASGGAEPDMRLQVRGRKSITASTNPLVVVDGIPYNGTLSEINQADIASIQVLKDASASAIYGSRGSNGVILITTARGSGAPRIAYDGYVGAQRIAHLPRMMTGPEFAAFKCQRLTAVRTRAAADPCTDEQTRTFLRPTELAHYEAGKATDWVDLATRTGIQQQHDLSVSGSVADTRYYLGATALDIGGVARNDEFARYTLRLNLDQKLHDWISLGTSTQLGLTDRGGQPASFSDAFYMNPLTSPYAEDGSQLVFPWPEDPLYGNPLQGLLAVNDDQTQRIFTSNFAQMDFPFLAGLSYRLNAGLDFSNREQGTYYGRDTRTGTTTQGQATTVNATLRDWTVENLVRFTRTFAGVHALDVTTLYGAQGSSREQLQLRAQGFPTDALTYRQANSAAQLTPSNSVTEWNLISQMGRINYGYDGRYLVTLTARRDGYSGFGENHKYGLFPSLALGWNASSEEFWPGGDAFNSLKLRLSWGKNGNQAINPYQTLARLRDAAYLEEGRSAPGYLISSLSNPDLRWETTTQLNLGADFGLFLDRVTGSLDVYDARTDDLLLNRAISPVHGINGVLTNMGETRNRGVELTLSTLNVDRADFSWKTGFNIAANRNEIVDLYGDGSDDIANRWFIGRPIDVNFGYRMEGVFQSAEEIAKSAQPASRPGDVRIRDANGDGKITPDDRVVLGNLEPTYTAGLTNTLAYRDLSLSFLFTTVQGVSRPNPLLDMELPNADVRRNTPYVEWWTPSNPDPNARFPANHEAANPLNLDFYEDASFVRLRDVTLAYSLPSSVTGRLGLQRMRLYLNGQNLWTRARWTGLDPELDSGEQDGIPLSRVFVLGVNTSF